MWWLMVINVLHSKLMLSVGRSLAELKRYWCNLRCKNVVGLTFQEDRLSCCIFWTSRSLFKMASVDWWLSVSWWMQNLILTPFIRTLVNAKKAWANLSHFSRGIIWNKLHQNRWEIKKKFQKIRSGHFLDPAYLNKGKR